MSLTFNAEPGHIERYAFSCGHPGGLTRHQFTTGDDAYYYLGDVVRDHGSSGPLAVCGEHDCTSGYVQLGVTPVESDPADAVQVSMSNGRTLVQLLGLDAHGALDPDLFLSRVLMAKAEITGGQRQYRASFGWPYQPEPGYLLEKFSRLETLARFAAERSRNVVWS